MPLLSLRPYLRHLTLGVGDEEGHVVDFILDHEVLLFSLEVLNREEIIHFSMSVGQSITWATALV